MMFSFTYPASFRPDESRRQVVSFPDFPFAHTDGKDANEAMEEAIDCLGSVLASLIAGKSDIPVPSRVKRGQRLVPVPLWIAGKLGLYLAMREKGVNNSELARRLGVRETVIRRMLDPDHETRSERIQAALEALGKRIVIAVEDAA
jgi:antitoxin HicB